MKNLFTFLIPALMAATSAMAESSALDVKAPDVNCHQLTDQTAADRRRRDCTVKPAKKSSVDSSVTPKVDDTSTGSTGSVNTYPPALMFDMNGFH